MNARGELATPPKAEDAKSYLELWVGFASGRSVPEVFTRLHKMFAYGTTDSDLRDAVEGYGLTRRITIANAAGLKKESVHAFLILLTALARGMDLIGTKGIWSETLKRLAPAPADNWGPSRRRSPAIRSGPAAILASISIPLSCLPSLGRSPPAGPAMPSCRCCWRCGPACNHCGTSPCTAIFSCICDGPKNPCRR